MTGWIKIWRCLLDWEWADVPEMVALWVRLLLMATHEEITWHGISIGTGEIVTTHEQLAAASGLTIKQVRICMARLTESGEISVKRAGKRQHVVISNYKRFQESENEKGQTKGNEKATKGQTKGRQRADKGQHNKNIRSKEQENIINNPQTPLQGDAPLPSVSETKKQPAKEKPEAHAVTRYDHVWEEIFQKMTNDTFVWSKRENVAVNTIVGKIVKMMEDAGKQPTDQEKEDALRWYLENLYQTGDDWVKANFTPHVIADKFNEYYQTIKIAKNGNKKQPTNATGVSADYISRVASVIAG